LEDKLIGVCFGGRRDKEHFGLAGIAIIYPYSKQGRGSILLKYFEDSVKLKGYKNISVGSGDGYVEHFYIKNGYTISSLKILTENNIWKEKKNDVYPISRIETQGIYTKLVIENIKYETTDKDEICTFYGGRDRFYIFEKNI
jgi:N-acetylglutamate synthase-like GNAT family acetyltransferase